MPCPLLIFSQSDFLIQIVAINSHNGKQCRSRSVGFFRSQLIWIYTVCKGKEYQGSPRHGLIYIIASDKSGSKVTIFLVSQQKYRLWVPKNLEEELLMSTHHMFLWRNKKNTNTFWLKRYLICSYRNNPKYCDRQTDRQTWANSVDPDQMPQIRWSLF